MRWECFRDALRQLLITVGFRDRNGLAILCWFGEEDRESQIRTKLISVQQQWHTQTQIEQTAPARHIFRTTTTLHTLLKLCAALGWKVCCVSLHYNPNALGITHQTHSRYKTEFRGDAGWADSVHRQPTVQEASGSLLPLQTLLNRHADVGHESVWLEWPCSTWRHVCLRDLPAVWTERVCVCESKKHVNVAAERCDVGETRITLKLVW